MKHYIVIIFALASIALGLNDSKECQAPGIKRGSSPRKFIVCLEQDGKLQLVENECSKGLSFDPVRKTCVTHVFPRVTILQAIPPNNMANITTTPRPSSSSTPNWGSTSPGNVTSRPTSWPTTTGPPPTTRPCRGSGAYCSNCNTLSFCVSNNLPAGARYLKNILELPCGSDSICVTQQGCVKKSDRGLCREGPFVCGDVGLYPDLYDCKTFHSCAVGPWGQLIDTPVTCSGGLLGNRWNPRTSTCGWSENDDSCRQSPVPICAEPLEMRSVGGQIYSICIVDESTHILSPRLFRCPLDLVFNASSYSCGN